MQEGSIRVARGDRREKLLLSVMYGLTSDLRSLHDQLMTSDLRSIQLV